jgi:hypothetical protein
LTTVADVIENPRAPANGEFLHLKEGANAVT